MARAGIEIESVELFQGLDFMQTGGLKRAFSVEGVEDDAFEEIAESQVVVIGEGAEDFQEAFLHTDAGLHAFDKVFAIFGHRLQPSYLGTSVPW